MCCQRCALGDPIRDEQAAEVTPIGQVNDRMFQVGPTTRMLMEEYARHVRE